MASNETATCPAPLGATPPTVISQAQAKALEQHANQMTVIYFTAAMAALCTLIIGAHFISEIHFMKPIKDRVPKRLVVARLVRSILLSKVPFLNSIGFALVFVSYLGINIALLLQNHNLNVPKTWTHRLGWLTVCNVALVIFLALKNTPLAFLTAYSYERINILHQAAGVCTIAFAVGHGTSDVYWSVKVGYTQYLLEQNDVMGMVAGCAMLVLLLTAATVRFFRYEVFYVAHIAMASVILIAAGMHRPDLVTKSTYVIIFAASIWVFDRAFRAGKILWNITSRATIHPLSDGGVRVVLRRTPFRAQPGAHVFLWIPKVRAFETHPFTIVSTKPLELVVSPQDGFTKELSALAIANPGATVRASCDGPYGTIPNFSKFDHVVLVAGGAGATFTFGIAHNLIRNLAPSAIKPMIHFIWVIREHEMQGWFEKELAELIASPNVQLEIYVTKPKPAKAMSGKDPVLEVRVAEIPPSIAGSSIEVRAQSSATSRSSARKQEYEVRISAVPTINASAIDLEKIGSETASSSTTGSNLPLTIGRPNLRESIRTILSRTEEEQRTMVAACGPDGLMRTTRLVVGDLIVSSGRSVHLHCEKFGW